MINIKTMSDFSELMNGIDTIKEGEVRWHEYTLYTQIDCNIKTAYTKIEYILYKINEFVSKITIEDGIAHYVSYAGDSFTIAFKSDKPRLVKNPPDQESYLHISWDSPCRIIRNFNGVYLLDMEGRIVSMYKFPSEPSIRDYNKEQSIHGDLRFACPIHTTEPPKLIEPNYLFARTRCVIGGCYFISTDTTFTIDFTSGPLITSSDVVYGAGYYEDSIGISKKEFKVEANHYLIIGEHDGKFAIKWTSCV